MKCVDLFCGCGGLSLGFEKAGFEIVAAIDNWKEALEVYKLNFKHDVIQFDLTDEDGTHKIIEKYQPEMIIGGPPCQDFSSAGKRDVTLGRADLTYHFANIVCNYKPEWFVMENVERIIKSHILKDVTEQFIANNYGLTAVILDASFCGVPQARTRFFLIGHLNGSHNELFNIFKNSLSKKPMTVRDYFGDELNLQYYYRHPRNYNRRGIFSIDEPSPTVRGVNRPVPAGYKKNSCDPVEAELDKIRPLTTLERSYIQTFPKTFKFVGTKTNLEQIIGNSVPVNLGKYVGNAIKSFLKNGKLQDEILTLFEMDNVFKIPDVSLKKDSPSLSFASSKK